MGMLWLDESVEQPARANGMRWYGRVLSRDEERFLRRECLSLKRKKTWMGGQEVVEIGSVGMGREDGCFVMNYHS